MNRVDDRDRWQYLRTRCVARRIVDTHPEAALAFTRSSLNRYVNGQSRLDPATINRVLLQTDRLVDSNVTRERSSGIRKLLAHGPFGCELWAALDARRDLDKTASDWNESFQRFVSDNGGSADGDLELLKSIVQFLNLESTHQLNKATQAFILSREIIFYRAMALTLRDDCKRDLVLDSEDQPWIGNTNTQNEGVLLSNEILYGRESIGRFDVKCILNNITELAPALAEQNIGSADLLRAVENAGTASFTSQVDLPVTRRRPAYRSFSDAEYDAMLEIITRAMESQSEWKSRNRTKKVRA